MTPDNAKATLLIEHCAERCGSRQKRYCENCEINAAIEALEKQIPKKPIGDLHSVPHYRCPSCYSSVKTYEKDCGDRVCRWCGQFIDWEAEE